ncbi:Receptor-like protein 7 [Linum grandiflorum]
MKHQHQLQLIWFLLMPLLYTLVGGQGGCQGDQESLLLQLKQGFTVSSSSLSRNLAGWDSSVDCCDWPGVGCDLGGLGRVIRLNLSNEMITGGFDTSMALFSLQYLQVLDLSFNNFNTTVPAGFGNLTNLRYLNLSNAGFFGQIPADISGLTNLVGLDLSMLYFPGVPSLKLEDPNLAGLVKNLSQLVDLRLDGVNISAQGNQWCGALASSLQNLEVLSMSNCFLSGPFDSSLTELESLSVIRLDSNEFASPVPDFFADFGKLTVLRLSTCGLIGTFPAKIFQIPSLEVLDLSNNGLLQGGLPEFPQNHSMQTLLLSGTNFSGLLPSSMGNLGKLSRIELEGCNFSGTVPKSMENFAQLAYVDLASNHFTGPIPSLGLSKKLVHLDLSYNQLSGDIPAQWESFKELVYVDLRHNSFNGSIPPSLFAIPSLQKLQLSFNKLRGPAPAIKDATSLVLDTMDLSSNNLEGSIPRDIFQIPSLKVLLLSSNRFNGSVQLNWIQTLQNLTALDLSCNNLTIEATGNNSTLSSFPQFSSLKLASANLRTFPMLGNQTKLNYLDLSDNNINGIVPRWILESTTLAHLNLSHNHLVGLEVSLSLPSLNVLDMHDNQLQGDVPISIIPSSTLPMTYVDYSHNFLNGSIPAEISNYVSLALFFSLSNNSLKGAIPASICNAETLQVLDLSNNNLDGSIPNCLMENVSTLAVLNLRGNKFSGNIPDTFQESCSLQTLDLSRNQLEGRVPKSLSNCTALEVLDLGNNRISDGFPCLLKSKTNLRVLILRSNQFFGDLGCPHIPGNWKKLQIVDLAFNNFSGHVDSRCLTTWEAMMGDKNGMEDHLKFAPFKFTQLYYQDSTTVTTKGLQLEFVKILTVFTSIDFSSNNFEGPIPETLGNFRALYVLNFSHNAFNGPIPSALGNLSQLESLDLSNNKLTGQIPKELTDLTFLSALNLSYNHLDGRIPTGRQFQTFENSSFKGNPDLCGNPITKSCSDNNTTGPSEEESGKPSIDWEFIVPGIGFGAGAALAMAPLLFINTANKWLDDHIDRILLVLLPLFGLRYYTSNDWRRVQPEEILEDYATDFDDEDDEDESYDEFFQGRYCVYCTKLDATRTMAIHDPKCNCRHSRTGSTFSSPFSSTTTL